MQDRLSVVKLPVAGYGGSVAYTGTAGNSPTFPGTISAVWVWCTTDAWVRVAVGNVAAVATDMPVPALQPVMIPVPQDANANCQVSAVQIAAGGTMYFCAMV